MMHPSYISRQSQPEKSFTHRYWHSQTGRTKFVIASSALIAATTLAYYWGYQDVDKRHNPERSVANAGDKRR
ncbi:hypothetical protein BDN67DRAFT_965753 [Paxillus ammoniavirescens]|nr:hypothetical protein BDN67DRAFT_965753 [Paxillus ammoniavirescens]